MERGKRKCEAYGDTNQSQLQRNSLGHTALGRVIFRSKCIAQTGGEGAKVERGTDPGFGQ